MQYLPKGTFLGQSKAVTDLDSILLVENEYQAGKTEWHYHEHAYFTFVLSGRFSDITKKNKYYCSPGSLLLHNRHEMHYDDIHSHVVKSLHIELKRPDFATDLNGGFMSVYKTHIESPAIKILFHQMYRETKVNDEISSIEIESLFLKAVDKLIPGPGHDQRRIPKWVNKVKEIILYEATEKITLKFLAKETGIHPVHLSRDFSKHFNCSLGNYIRQTKIEKALSLLANKNMSLTEIAFECGFADQSHFLRTFKQIVGETPSQYRKVLLS